MSTMRRAALDTLAADFASHITGVTVGPVPSPDAQNAATYSGIAFVPGKFKLVPQQRQARARVNGTDQLWSVGRVEGALQVRAYGPEPAQRQDLEERITWRFFSQPGRRAVMVLTTPALTLAGIATLYPAAVSFELQGAEWNEERVFARRRYSFMDVVASYPLLIVESAVPLMSRIFVHVTQDLHTPWPNVSPPATEFEVTSSGPVPVA